MRLGRAAQRLRYARAGPAAARGARLPQLERAARARGAGPRCRPAPRSALERSRLRLELLDPRLVLQRGYALLTDDDGARPSPACARPAAGQALRATLADGEVDLTVAPPRLI